MYLSKLGNIKELRASLNPSEVTLNLLIRQPGIEPGHQALSAICMGSSHHTTRPLPCGWTNTAPSFIPYGGIGTVKPLSPL